MFLRTIGVATVALCMALPAAAQNDGRYALERGEFGFIRLDTETGEMTLCRETSEGLDCDTARDNAAEIRRERDELRDENRDLRRENARLNDDLDRYEDFSADHLPSEQEIEEVATWFERVLIIMARTMRNAEEGIDEEMQREDE